MMQDQNKIFLLVAVKGSRSQVEAEGVIKFVQCKIKEMRASGNWRGWKLWARSPEGYKLYPLAPPKKLKKKLDLLK